MTLTVPVAHALERQRGPLGKLLLEQAADERLVDLELVRVDAGHQPKP